MNAAARLADLEQFCRDILRRHAETPQQEWIVDRARELVPDEPSENYGQDFGND